MHVLIVAVDLLKISYNYR